MKVPNHNYLWFNFRNVLHCLIDCWYIQKVRTRCHTFWSKKHISFAKFVNVNCFSDWNSKLEFKKYSGEIPQEFWKNFGRILEEFWRNSWRILKKLRENSEEILEEFRRKFWKNSRRILKKFSKNSLIICFFSKAVVQNSTFGKSSWLPNSSRILKFGPNYNFVYKITDMPSPSASSKFGLSILKFFKHVQFFMYTQNHFGILKS